MIHTLFTLKQTLDQSVDAALQSPSTVRSWRRRSLDDSPKDLGQATTEYALVLLAAALVGLLVIGWATAGGGAAAIGGLFNRVISSVTGKV